MMGPEPAAPEASLNRLHAAARSVTGWVRRHHALGGRPVTEGTVRLPTVMTFVVAMFVATMALVLVGSGPPSAPT
jgi:hypothetical protein